MSDNAPPREKDIFGREPVGYPDWSHRRGEPRLFALIWMLFLMGVTIIMFWSLSGAISISPTITRPAAQRMLLTTMLGIALLWPAIRLSQAPAEEPVRATLRDLFIILVPAQAVIWPHTMRVLAWWPLSLLLALAASMVAWAAVVGGVIACADAGRRVGVIRWAWMLLIVFVVFAAPVYAMGTSLVGATRPDIPRPGWMFSPVTAVLELTRDRAAVGKVHPVALTHWRLIGATACVGGALFCIAGGVRVASRRCEV